MWPHRSRLNLGPARRRCRAFTMAELLVVMAIITILAASLVVVVPSLRAYSMRRAAGADIHMMSIALQQYDEDCGSYPTKPYNPADAANPAQSDFIDYVLYRALCDVSSVSNWGGARPDWEFLRGESNARQQILDPWAVPYYYIPCTDYLSGVGVNDPTDGTLQYNKQSSLRIPNCYGTTPRLNDYRGDTNTTPNDTGTPVDRTRPRASYSGPPPDINAFYNATTFQIHSKGPDQLTDIDEGKTLVSGYVVSDACDRGTDYDDINNWSGK